jgi:1-deoxy-D-xylulose-5-phosphate synthase
MLVPGRDVAILGTGTMAFPAQAAAEALRAEGVDAAAVNARFLKPLDEPMLAELLKTVRLVVTVEEGTLVNGFGAMLAARLERSHPWVRTIALGIPDELMVQASRARQLEHYGLTPEGIADVVRATLREAALP